MSMPKIKQVSCSRENLRGEYLDLLDKNPLLGRIEGTCKTIGWNDEEIRTMQLITAVASNMSLQRRLKEMELGLAKINMAKPA